MVFNDQTNYDRGPGQENYQIVANGQRNVDASLRKGIKNKKI